MYLMLLFVKCILYIIVGVVVIKLRLNFFFSFFLIIFMCNNFKKFILKLKLSVIEFLGLKFKV